MQQFFFFFPLILENAQTFISSLSWGMLVQLQGAVGVSVTLPAGQGPAGVLLPRELSGPSSAHAALPQLQRGPRGARGRSSGWLCPIPAGSAWHGAAGPWGRQEVPRRSPAPAFPSLPCPDCMAL